MQRIPISFMSLPAEIRNQIYELTVLDPASHDVYNRNPPLGLLHLNSQVRREYLAYHFNTHIFHVHTLPSLCKQPSAVKGLLAAAPEATATTTRTSNQLSLFRGLEPVVLDSLRELMLHVHSSNLLSATFTPKKDNFDSILKTISLASNLEVLHLNSCGKHANSLSQLIERSTTSYLFPKLLLLVIHTDRQQYADYIGKKVYACKDLEWWKHESHSLARCRECGKAHLVEVTWRVIAKKSKGGYGSEEKHRLMKVGNSSPQGFVQLDARLDC